VPFLPTTESVEISIFDCETGPILKGAIELVSPANKDRATHHAAFVSKCETYLRQGIGLIVVDVVTARQANLHGELLARLTEGKASSVKLNLYAVAYRASAMDSQAWISGRKNLRSAILYQLYPCGCTVRFACQLIWRQPMSVPVENNGLQ
jgi:hypothetical protein